MFVLFAACGFIGGVLVQKNQQGTATGSVAAATICSFSSRDQRRRRCTEGIT